MSKPSRYEELMNKHNIVSIKGGSDLALDLATGGLAMSKRGDLKWQGKAHNAMFKFVRNFEMYEPQLLSLFDNILQSQINEVFLVEKINISTLCFQLSR